MNRIFAVTLLVSMLSPAAPGQPIALRTVCALPSIIEETSGLEITDGYTFWSHNDSGGEPEIYMFDSLGAYYRSMRILNAANVDWEDLAQDDAGNFYIGDFGNNSNNRNDLRIYKIPNPLPMSTDRTNAEIISFTYADQTEFPPPAPQRHYDMEAMFWHAGALYLFTKNRTNPFDGMVYMYKLPDTAGIYSISRVDSFYTGPGQMLTNWVTSADISPDGTRAILLSQSKMWLFSGFSGDSFLSGNAIQYDFDAISQTEAVCFATNTEVYITDELAGGVLGGKLYRVDLPVASGLDELPQPEGHLLKAYPNPFSQTLTVSLGGNAPIRGSFSLYSALGGCVYRALLTGGHLDEATFRLSLPYSAVPRGMYLAVVQTPLSYKTMRVVRE